MRDEVREQLELQVGEVERLPVDLGGALHGVDAHERVGPDGGVGGGRQVRDGDRQRGLLVGRYEDQVADHRRLARQYRQGVRGAGSQVAPGGRKSATSATSSRWTARSRCRAGVGPGAEVAATDVKERVVAMRGQLFRARSSSGRSTTASSWSGPSRTYVVRAGRRPGCTALEGLRVRRAATHPVEVVMLTGRPEGLQVGATRRGVPLEAGHVSIEADTGAGQESPLTGRTRPWRELDVVLRGRRRDERRRPPSR